MKKVIAAAIIAATLLKPVGVQAETQLHKCWATAYCLTGETASGTQTTEGRTVASKPEWIGSTMFIWLDDGDGVIKAENYLGMYQVEDTGGRTIKNGSVIDVYIADYNRAKQFGSRRVIIQVVKGDG